MAEPWVELRVHGVSGTPPESMLDIDRVRQVAGDEFGRTFRRADRLGAELAGSGDRITEAYHWGRLTSGSVVQGLWLLLAPFGLVNAAQFTLERPGSGWARFLHAVAGMMLRLVGLALTVLFVIVAAIITIDLWAWQRAGATAGFPYALAMLGPVALLLVYFALIRSEPALNAAVEELPSTDNEPERPSELVRKGFFEGSPDAPALRLLHFAAGLTVVAVLGFAPRAVGPDPSGRVLFLVAAAVLGLVTLAVAALGDPEGSASTSWDSTPRTTRRKIWKNVGRVLLAASLALLGTAIARVLGAPPERVPTGMPSHYPGIDLLSYLVMAVAVTGLAVLLIANGLLAYCQRNSAARGSGRFAPYAKGMACSLLTSFGVFLGVGYAGAFTTVLARSLSTTEVTVKVPALMSRVVYAWGITALVLGALVVVAMVSRALSPAKFAEAAMADYPRRPPGDRLQIPDRWIARITGAIWTARLKNRIVCVLTGFFLLGAVLTMFVAIELWPQLGDPPTWPLLHGEPQEAGRLAWISQSETAPDGADPVRVFLLTLGTVTLTALATALFFLGRTALLGESARRGVNVVWDVIAFWPRSAHPFVPAAYSQRAVPDLHDRICWHLGQLGSTGEHRRLVLCAHSQGSLISFAALLRLAAGNDALLDRIGLVTFGSQLQVMFSRGFPAYVNQEAITHLYRTLHGAWRNLYRDTDPLAGPVLSWNHRKGVRCIGLGEPQAPQAVRGDSRQEFGPDWRLYDPPFPADPCLQGDALHELRGHSDYWLDRAWTCALDEVRLRPARPRVGPAQAGTSSAPAAAAITPPGA